MRRLWTLLLIATLVVSAGTALGQTSGVVRGGPLPGPLPLFPPDNWWNNDITSAPVDPNSAGYITFIGPARSLHPDLGGDTGDVAPDSLTFGMPYVVVPGSQPLEQVVFEFDDESDYAAPARPPGYPIPAEAKSEPRWVEGGVPANDSRASGDRHLLIVDRDQRVLFELFALQWNQAMNRWEAGSGAIFPLDSNARRPDGWTSADAAGLAILPGLIRHDEAYGDAPIRHGFRVTVRATNGYVYPASHRAGSTAGALPMGARLRLKASKDISGFAQPVRKIFQAMKTHGLIVADNGSDMFITGTYDTRWDNDLLNPAFRSLTAADFEVIQLGWQPSATPSCTQVAILQQPAGSRIVAGQTLTLSVAVSGTPPVTFQWYAGMRGDRSSPLAGSILSSVVVAPNVTTSYWVSAANACSSAESETATVLIGSARRRAARRP